MDPPEELDAPFFAYGIFRKGELRYLSIADLVEDVDDPVSMPGALYLRDGLPILDVQSGGSVQGTMIFFKPGSFSEAYGRIIDIEPEKQYRWGEVEFHGLSCNCLVGKSPRKGAVPADEGWNGRDDPLFTSALDVIEETLEENQEFDWDLKPMFRLQMAYLLLWSAIERYASLRYGLGKGPTERDRKSKGPTARVKLIGGDPVFADLLQRHVTRTHRIQDASNPQDRCDLDPSEPSKSVTYYYQIRNNITHRGKGVTRDHETVRDSLQELLPIFRGVLDAAFDKSEQSAP